MSNFKVNIRQTFEGVKVFSSDLPASFLPISFGITNTFALLAGLALLVLFIWQFRKNKQAPILYFIGFTALFPLLYIIYTKANVYHAWRHVLFIFPSMIVLATFGWNSIISYFEQKNVKLVGMGMLGFLLLEPTYFIATTFPNTITYHNQLVGGVQGAYNNYEVDYYYNSLKQSADWFKKNELPKYKKTDTIKIYSNAAHILTHYFENEKNVIVDYIRYPERNQKAWDYIIMHIALIPVEDIKTGNWLPPSTLFKASSQGKILSAVIKRPSTDDLKAFELLNQNQPDAAIGYFDSYLKADPKNTSILNTVGNILMQLGRIDSAEQYINKSYQADSSNMETKQFYGMMRLQKNDFATAQTIFSQIIQENPQYARAYYFLGMAQMGAGSMQQALNNFNTASQDESLRQSCYKNMGDCYMKMENQAEAMKLYQAAGLQ
jgi:tetratricopeptide (TPR) repeat protein